MYVDARRSFSVSPRLLSSQTRGRVKGQAKTLKVRVGREGTDASAVEPSVCVCVCSQKPPSKKKSKYATATNEELTAQLRQDGFGIPDTFVVASPTKLPPPTPAADDADADGSDDEIEPLVRVPATTEGRHTRDAMRDVARRRDARREQLGLQTVRPLSLLACPRSHPFVRCWTNV